MALPTIFRSALDRLYDLVTADADGCVSERVQWPAGSGRMWKVRVIWRRDEAGKLRLDITVQER
jgi:hypothetical protein